MKGTILLLLLAALPVVTDAKPELKGNPEELRQFLYPTDTVVTIHAEAAEKAYSDKAIVSLVITTEDKLLSNSIAKNSAVRAAITQQLVAAGIGIDNIKSSKFSTSPQYGWFGKKPNSYKVVNRMAISIITELHLQEIASVADSEKEAELSGATFEHTQKDEFENKVKAQALAKIMKQKEFYESSLSIKLIPVGFRRADIGRRATPGAMILEEVVVTATRQSRDYRDTVASESTAVRAEASFDEIQYEAMLYVDFKIEAAN